MTFFSTSRTKRAIAFGVTAAMTVAPIASALDMSTTDKDASINLVSSALENLEENHDPLLVQGSEPSQVGHVALGAGSVEVPRALEDDVVFTSPDGESISIELPNADESGTAALLDDGVVAYEGEDSANSLVVGESSVQMLTTIASSDAPNQYSYEVSLKPGQELQLVDSGGAIVLNDDGTVALAVAAPWAVDANGTKIATEFQVNGSTLTQQVDHSSVDNVTYPVVADPIWLAPWIIRCLVGIGLNGPQITRIASLGSPWSIAGAFGWAAVRCVFGR